MRLINTETLKLHEFFNTKTTAYAILSHCWEEDEVTFQDLRDGKGLEKKGWEKIKGCCAKASEDGWEYVWIDTCCIDKTSSAELSESINSMFAWYKNSHICYTYLSDVPRDFRDPETSEIMSIHNALERSRWFTRGWTLQELLAPQWVVFLTDDWTEIGTKASLATDITLITGITHLFNFEEASVAQRMSWAAFRKTTRLEDQAYCMMGLFDVNMPLLYGEGKKAFVRLQLEILSKSDDESIFAWSYPSIELVPRPGLLADTSQGFEGCGRIRRKEFDPSRPPHFMTNKGLQMQLLLYKIPLPPEKVPHYISSTTRSVYVAPLNCALEDENGVSNLVILYLINEGGTYSRYGDPDIGKDEYLPEMKGNGDMKRTLCHIKQFSHNDSMVERSLPDTVSYTISFDTSAIYDAGYRISERIVWPQNASLWNFWRVNLSGTGQLAVTITSSNQFILVKCESPFGAAFTLILGYISRRPWLGALTDHQVSLRELVASFDEHDRWPRSQSDPRTYQDRGWVQIGNGRYIDVALHKTGVGRSSTAEKYRVEMRIREELEEMHEKDDGSGQLMPQQQSDSNQ